MAEMPYSNAEVIKLVEAAQANEIAQKKTAAKKLGIEYDAKTEQPWVETMPDKTKTVSWGNQQVTEIVNNWVRAKKENNYQTFNEIALKNGAIATYQMPSEYGGFNADGSSYLRVIKDGKESFKPIDNQNFDPMQQKGFASIETSGIRTTHQDMLKDLILPGQALVKSKQDGSIPLLASFSVAEESLGLKSLPANAKPNTKLDRIKDVRGRIAGQTVQVCSRNSTSAELLAKTISQIEEIEQNKNNKEYTKPTVIYGLPTVPCGEVRIVKDTRTDEQKKADAKQEAFDQQFGKVPAAGKIVTFRIVGLLPDMADMYANSVSGILSGVMSSSIGSGWVVPENLVTLPELAGIVQDPNKADPFSLTYIAELPSTDAQKKFIAEQSCQIDGLSNAPIGAPMPTSVNGVNTQDACAKQEKYFVYRSFGNNAAAITDFKRGFNKVFSITLAILAVLSAVIMMGTIGRIIADSRRETAVFRAIGATRFDMATVYTIYTLIMALFVSFAAIGFGMLAATIFNAHYSPIVTPSALLVFNTADYAQKFVFFGLDTTRLLTVAGAILLASLIGMLPPLIGNLRRSPLRDMRDEN